MRHVVAAATSLLSWTLVILCAGALVIDDWAPWHRLRRDGQSAGFELPHVWPKKLEQRWQVEVGLGHSSPLVAGGKIYIFTRRGDNEAIACLNPVDGKQIWLRSYPAPYQVTQAATHGKGPKSTPVVAGGRLFSLGISGILSCLDAKSGKILWQKDFSKQFDPGAPAYGTATSPLVEDDKCLVHVGGSEKGALMAIDVHTGDTLWSCAENGPAYASPIVATLGDVRQVVTQSHRACLGVDLEDGKLLWKIPFQTDDDPNSVAPLAHDGSIVVSGLNQGVDCYRVEKQDDEWETDNTWENKEVSLTMSSPVTHGDTLFGFSHRQKGQFFALDLTTGKTLWTSDGRLGENAALVATGDVVWALTTQSELTIFRANEKQFDPLAHYKVAESPTRAHPAIVSGGVLIKDETKLTLWQFAKPQ